jgi:hypothetical protein
MHCTAIVLPSVPLAVLLHMDLAVKYDGELGQAWLRRLRGDTAPRLSPFAFAVSFMLAGIVRFEQPVTGAWVRLCNELAGRRLV